MLGNRISQLSMHMGQIKGNLNTYSLPVQNVDASLANHAITPRSSSGLPILPIGFKLDHLSNKCGCESRYAAVMLQYRGLGQHNKHFSLQMHDVFIEYDARCVYMPRRERVDTNFLFSKFTSHAAGHLKYSRFATIVGDPGMVLFRCKIVSEYCTFNFE